MSSPQCQALPAQPDAAQISNLVSSIVLKARENDSLSSLTPRLVRSEVETQLGVPSGTLDMPPYKALVKRTIHDAMKREQTSGASERTDEKTKNSVSKLNAGKGARSSASKSIKSKETITDSESENERKPPSLKRKVKPYAKADDGEEKFVRPNSKAKSTKADSKTSKNAPPPAETSQSRKKRGPPPALAVESDSNGESSDTAPKATSSPRRVADNKKSDSEMSSLVDEPPKKKARAKSKNSEAGKSRAASKRPKQPSHTLSKDEETIKRLKSLVVACGVRKQWTRELDGLSTSAQVAHIRHILTDLGMAGRMSLEQAREIRARRELAQELDDVQKFERAIVSGKPFKTESPRRRVAKKNDDSAEDPNDSSGSGHDSASEREPPKVNNARRSIMTFLQDQSSDDD